MKRLLIGLIVVLSAIALLLLSSSARSSASFLQQTPKESKEQPKKVKLDTDSLDDKWGEVAFDHETHSIKSYNSDGKTVTSCVFCHNCSS